MRLAKFILVSLGIAVLVACSGSPHSVNHSDSDEKISYQGRLDDPIMTIALLSEHQREWAGTPYRLGGQSRRGIDCSGFVQKTFRDRFNIQLPRTTKEQVKYGIKVPKSQIQTGDLVFFKTGRGPNGYHVGIYVKDGQFLHASTKGGVIYSSLNSPYWTRTYWQARRM
ncbi:C40 family peptidase [Avibacterium sp. 21-599]|uniref:C40 family peptidase n=1 Tax=Avibacterium sp. 21-599 TaxID=2911528 RepID=UPI002247014B|nr:NlpC/P60 family protein [Avibacterium sp. 21-599]MCW9718327.1 NlpC/P60 family protein [Avibacterium sp. 21-599]